MNLTRMSKTFAGTLFSGSVASGLGAAAGAAGAAILDASGYKDYAVIEAAKMGAIGGAILVGGSSLLSGLRSFSLFGSKGDQYTETAVGYVGGSVLEGLTGYGILNAGNLETVMSLAKTAAAFAVGGAVTCVPASWLIVAVALPIAAKIAALEERAFPAPEERARPIV